LPARARKMAALMRLLTCFLGFLVYIQPITTKQAAYVHPD
jgi:hypothetical protein